MGMTHTPNTTTDRTTEVAHDTELLRLLRLVGSAQAAVDQAEQRVLASAASYHVGHDGSVRATGSDASSSYHANRRRWADVPDGAVFYQAKTFTRGDEGYYLKDVGRTPPHAVERIASGDCSESYACTMQRTHASLNDAASDATPEAIATWENATTVLADARDAVQVHELGYTGWSRYFLVTSSAGHVHSSMHCSSCNWRTTYAPVVQLSATSDAEAVELLGETLCSVCFPDAPVDGRPSKLTKAAARKLLA